MPAAISRDEVAHLVSEAVTTGSDLEAGRLLVELSRVSGVHGLRPPAETRADYLARHHELIDMIGEGGMGVVHLAQGPDGRHFVPYALRSPLHAGVQAMVSQDKRSVLLRLPGPGSGWILRNDVLDIVLEPLADRPGAQLVLRGQKVPAQRLGLRPARLGLGRLQQVRRPAGAGAPAHAIDRTGDGDRGAGGAAPAGGALRCRHLEGLDRCGEGSDRRQGQGAVPAASPRATRWRAG